MTPSTLRTLAVASLAATCLQAHSANLLANGSFETPGIVATNVYQLFSTGSTAITGWTVLGPSSLDSIQLTPDTYLGLKAADGRQWIDLTGIYGYDKGLRSDAVAVTPGTTYRIEFDVGNYLPFGRSTLGVSINGGSESLYTDNSLAVSAHYPMNWAHYGFDWVADAATLRLSFLGRANGALSNNAGIGLDNVSVTAVKAPVPEPGTWALLAAGLGVVGALSGRRRALR